MGESEPYFEIQRLRGGWRWRLIDLGGVWEAVVWDAHLAHGPVRRFAWRARLDAWLFRRRVRRALIKAP